jgi:alpha-beta hydrolase superfamily lysophospholipase
MIPVNQIITIKTSDNHSLIGLLWEDDDCRENKTIILHVRGKTGTPITEPLTSPLAEVYAKNKIATLVIELHRSGYGGSLESLAQMDVEDIHAFVQFLLKRGYTRIILSGQSLGSNSIMRYGVQYPHPNIIAMVHFAPTQDCANWLENHLGSETYNSLVKQGKKAIEDGQGNTGLIGKPPYDKMLSPHRPNAWLSWWGPDADTANLKTISEVTIPILMLCGSEDFFNDRERIDTLKAAATRSPITDIIWYEGCGHNFANFEQQAANDVVTWLNQL